MEIVLVEQKNTTPKQQRGSRKQDTPPAYVHKDLVTRAAVKMVARSKKLHFKSALALLDSLNANLFTMEFKKEKAYGFYPIQFVSKLDLSMYDTMTFNVHYHNVVMNNDDRGKPFYQLVPFPIDPNLVEHEFIMSDQTEEERAILELQRLMYEAMQKFAENDLLTDAFVKAYPPSDLSKLRVKAPPASIKGNKVDVIKMLKQVDDNHDVCVEIAGGWVVNKDDSPSDYFCGVTFKLLPWLHQWFFVPAVETTPTQPIKPKRVQAPKKRVIVRVAPTSSEETQVSADEAPVAEVMEEQDEKRLKIE